MTRRLTIDDLTALAVPSQPAVSPDGSRVVYVLRTLDGEQDRNVDQLWTVPTAGGTPRRLTGGPDDTAPAWSPDGTRLAFLREGQVHVLAADGGEPERVTDLPLGAGAPVWSPNGERLAFSAPVDPAGDRGGTGPLVARRVDYQADGSGFFGATRRQLHVVDVASGDCRQITDGDHAGQPAWSPDGRTVAFTRRAGADSDLTYQTAVHVVDVDDPKARPRVVALEDGIAGTVSFTNDGEGLLVVGHPELALGHAHLFRVPLDGGAPTDLSGHLDRNVMPGGPAYPGARPVETADGRVLFTIRDRGCSHLHDVDGPVLAGAGRVVSGLSVAGTTAVVALATPTSYGEIVALDLTTGAETVLTDHGMPDVELFVREERTFTISDGTEVQGWLVRDPATDVERDGPLPLLLDIHGGPHNAWNAAADEMHLYHQALAARGWAVLLLNPRGSDGYGAAFYDGVNAGWGVHDVDDFLEPLDALVAEGLADRDRLAVTGYSYGGFMTCWLTGHDDRFKAAVAGGVVSDLTSEFGSSDDGVLMGRYELGGTPWEAAEQYAAMSPITHVDEVTTPTLVLHGKDDLTCPVGQAQQWHTSLRRRGVPTELVLYPDASHVFILLGKPSQRLDYNRRVVAWVEQYAVRGGRPRLDVAHWQRRLEVLARRHHVPGAQLGILDGDDLAEAAYGVLNNRTGQPVTTDSLFQIGSISKVWTATVVMQLLDEDRIALDTPVIEVLPELQLSDPDVTKQLTVWHLLTHTSGIDGDVFTDTGRGDDCLEKYVALLADVAQNHPLGATWSYCNSGWSLLGRVIERLTDQTWDQAMKERLFTPLGLDHTVTLAEEAILFAAAVGHVDVEGEQVPTPVWDLPRSVGPAGLIKSTVRDVLGFARMHLSGGRAPDGTQVLSSESTEAMTRHEADLPDKFILGDSWGLGWIRFGWHGHRLIGHDGNTLGQAGFLRLLPGQDVAVALLANGGNTRDLYEDLYREIFAEVAGVEMSAPFAPPAEPVEVDVAPYVGTYARSSVRMEVLADGPTLRTTVLGPLAEMVPDPVDEYPMVPVGPALFAVRPPEADTWAPVTFYELPTGERYVHFGVRATPRVD
ncbi:serine hydrolase [Nocardioides sp. YIM 152315]|uniref:serine hydrolase n=1 Tax=Nocardioides sp. YIM 152315 TaxID=3031760 RepID=UPI0023DB941D|nr:serine hydrolase [Nocardioides sp. YIM 152315]MDF1603810.1 serine hydrolase [Nocardioides sp. YIM 152315]